MKPLEILTVDSPDKTGAAAYESVIRDVLSDLQLNTVIGRLWVYIDPKEPVFTFCALIRTGLPPICIRDIAEVDIGAPGFDQVIINIINEEYVPLLLNILWAKYGRENVEQPDQLTVTLSTEDKTGVAATLGDVVIADPRRQIEARLADALLRITPEGFRIRYHTSTESEMLFVASEDPIRSEWTDRAKDMMNQLKGD